MYMIYVFIVINIYKFTHATISHEHTIHIVHINASLDTFSAYVNHVQKMKQYTILYRVLLQTNG